MIIDIEIFSEDSPWKNLLLIVSCLLILTGIYLLCSNEQFIQWIKTPLKEARLVDLFLLGVAALYLTRKD